MRCLEIDQGHEAGQQATSQTLVGVLYGFDNQKVNWKASVHSVWAGVHLTSLTL